jgi:Domain of Unknown Function (DUF1080)
MFDLNGFIKLHIRMSVYEISIAKKGWLKIILAVLIVALSLAFQTVTTRYDATGYPKSVIKKQWINLFDGETLNGWHALPGGSWNVEDGILVGRSDQKEDRHGILVSDKQYKNFEIEVVYKAVKGNSGLYFRSKEVGDVYGVLGFQAEIDPAENAGGLYETGGRQWVSQPSPEEVKKYYKPGEWNSMRVLAVNGDITVTVNGTTSADLHNDPGSKQGHFGLQLHGGQEMLVMFKVIRIKEL